MIKNLSSTKKELEGIKQEGENIEVGYETKKGVKYWTKKGALIGALALTLTATSSYMPVNPTITAEAKAKKDTKKPTLKFKGKTTMTAEKGKNITIPKVTAKDNKDGNITKKIQVSVKKGTKNYASLAKKIKNGKNVKFSDIGKYVITYTVKDKAGNKTTKKRYVNVVLPKTKTTEAPVPYVIERPSTTQATTTKAPVTTEAPVTTQTPPTTENPYPVAPTPTDFSKYDIEQVTVGENTYNVTSDWDLHSIILKSSPSEGITLNIENDYSFVMDKSNPLLSNSMFLKYLGKLTAFDGAGNDISNNIIISRNSLNNIIGNFNDTYTIFIYVEDALGNSTKSTFRMNFFTPSSYDEVFINNLGYTLINEEEDIYVKQNSQISSKDIKQNVLKPVME